MNKNFAAIASISLATAIVLGAWNAHGMEQLVQDGKMSLRYIKTFYTGVQYQFICSLGLLILSTVNMGNSRKLLLISMWTILSGMLLFSGTLYPVALHEMIGVGFKKLAIITPFGGLLMTAGWLLAAAAFIRKKP